MSSSSSSSLEQSRSTSAFTSTSFPGTAYATATTWPHNNAHARTSGLTTSSCVLSPGTATATATKTTATATAAKTASASLTTATNRGIGPPTKGAATPSTTTSEAETASSATPNTSPNTNSNSIMPTAMASFSAPSSSSAAAAAAAALQWTPEVVASLPPPGLGGPTQIVFAPESSRYLAYVHVQPSVMVRTKTSAVPVSIYKPLTTTAAPLTSTTTPSASILATTATTTTAAATSTGTTTTTGSSNANHSLTSFSLLSSLTSLPSHQQQSSQQQQHQQQAQSATSTTTTTTSSTDRLLLCLDLQSPDRKPQPLLRWNSLSFSPTSALANSSVNNNAPETSPDPVVVNARNTPIVSDSNNNIQTTTTSKRRMMEQGQNTTLTATTTSQTTALVGSNSSSSSSSNSSSSSSSSTSVTVLQPQQQQQQPLVMPLASVDAAQIQAWEERLRRERLRFSTATNSLTQFSWTWVTNCQQHQHQDSSAVAGPRSTVPSSLSSTTSTMMMRDEIHPSAQQHSQHQQLQQQQQGEQASSSSSSSSSRILRILVPARGSLFVQDGLALDRLEHPAHQQQDSKMEASSTLPTTTTTTAATMLPAAVCIHDKSNSGQAALDAQLSPDGSMVAWTCDGDLFVQSATPCFLAASATTTTTTTTCSPPQEQQQLQAPRNSSVSHMPTMTATTSSLQDSVHQASPAAVSSIVRLTFESNGHSQAILGITTSEDTCISYGTTDFVAQEEMDRYRGFWWHPDSTGILLTKTDESNVPIYRIMHHQDTTSISSVTSSSSNNNSNNNNSVMTTPDVALHSTNPVVNLHVATGNANSSHHSQNHHHHHHHHHHSHNRQGGANYEDHRYPFAGKENPVVKLGFLKIDRASILQAAASAITASQATSPALPPDNIVERHSVADDVREGTAMEQDQDGDYKDDDGGDRDDDINNNNNDAMPCMSAQEIAVENWETCHWFDAPREASEYLARVHWLSDGCAVTQWQNRTQTVSVLYRLDLQRCKGRTLLVERSETWINLHHMFRALKRPIHPDECAGTVERNIPPIPKPLPTGSSSFLFASERSGYAHLYLYTFVPGINGEQAILIKALSAGEWMVESIVGVDEQRDIVYVTGTFDSVLERHLYALPLTEKRRFILDDSVIATTPSSTTSLTTGGGGGGGVHHGDDSMRTPSSSFNYSPQNHNGVRRGLSKVMHALSGKVNRGRSNESSSSILASEQRHHPSSLWPIRLTQESGMHSIVMDDHCQYFVDTSSDLNRPTSVKIYAVPSTGLFTSGACSGGSIASVKLLMTLYDATQDEKSMAALTTTAATSGRDQGERLINNLPAPELISFPTTDASETLYAALYQPDPQLYGPGPYPLVCAVYGGPHVQRVNRSWSQCADMRAQRLRSLGFCVVKCDNRGSSRRGLAFECAIARRLGRLEVLDQVATVRHLIMRGIVDPNRVGVYGWSYGGYLAAMCLCRAPDVFNVAVAGAPVTSWDGYDTHYTERYMGLPSDNPAGYRESAIFDHVPNMRGKLMIVHGLIDENVHFRHTTRLVNKLIAAGKDYDLLIFPEERHSPRRLRDRIYMEQRISDYFVRHLRVSPITTTPTTTTDFVMPSSSSLSSSYSSAPLAAAGAGSSPGLRTMAGHL